jgi:hypothetical protein
MDNEEKVQITDSEAEETMICLGKKILVEAWKFVVLLT